MIDSGEAQKLGVVDVTSAKSGRTKTVELGRPTLLDVESGQAVHYFVPVTIPRDGGIEINAGTFVLRSYTDPEDGILADSNEDTGNEEFIDKYIKNYQFLKEHGFPVAETVRRVENKDALLITDLRLKNNVVFSLNEILQGRIDPINKIANLDEVNEQVMDLAVKADNIGLLIEDAAYFVLLDQTTNRAQVIVGDLGDIYLPGEYEYDSEHTSEPMTNTGEAQAFLNQLKNGSTK